MSRACLVDLTRCIGCRGCQVSCKQWNSLKAEQTSFFAGRRGFQNPPALSADTFTLVAFNEFEEGGERKYLFAKRQCMHCLDPACVSACPVAALKVTDDGAVIYEGDKCMGCRYCMMACPFGVPTYEWERTIPYVKKCTFCSDRDAGVLQDTKLNGQDLPPESASNFRKSFAMPACAKTCPTGAIKFGDRGQLLDEAHTRIAGGNGKYIDHVYGEHEAGGTSWLYLSAVPFGKLGFPDDVGTRPYSSYTAAALESVPLIVVGGGAVLGGLYWLYQRKQELAGVAVDKDGDA